MLSSVLFHQLFLFLFLYDTSLECEYMFPVWENRCFEDKQYLNSLN